MTELDRRSFLKTGAAVAGGAALAGPFQGYVAAGAWAAPTNPAAHQLVPVPDQADGVVRLALPPGFAYRSFDDRGKSATLTVGNIRIPGRHDGMAAFAGPAAGISTLVRNHEVALPAATTTPPNPAGNTTAFGSAATAYDPKAPGGTTTVEVDGEGHVIKSYVSLNGTLQNCSGGPTPWGTWLTCEETVNGPDVGPDFTGITNAFLTKRHGYVFEVPSDEPNTSPVPIRNAGRFAHESVAWDPHSGALYLSEDNFGFPSGFYKYVPPTAPAAAGGLADGGTLWMLKVKGVQNANLARKHPDKATYDVEWVKIDNPDFGADTAPVQRTNNAGLTFVSNQGLAKGAARFSRLEGTIYDAGLVYFTSTQGGGEPEATNEDSVDGWGNGWGQIWAYDSRTEQLHLLFESPNRNVLDFPDNVTTSPRGTLVVCEDHDDYNFLRGLTRRGKLITFAQNVMVGRTGDEFAGSTFSRTGSTLYVNIQSSNGLTFAIWGDWESIGI